ncbi:MAG TPA: response regulator [Bryobacteraceae bacterium]|jgi:two-component system chemotaxis response regulator CheY|nr:response regulator [Bryobacteraceae bacterium]
MSHAMVVDDSKAVRMILSRSLVELGYDVCAATDGAEALTLLREEMSLVLVDWNMPHMNGLEFLEKLRADPRYASIKVIMVTTETEVDQMVKALAAGADEYVMKPFTKEILADKLRVMGLIQ